MNKRQEIANRVWLHRWEGEGPDDTAYVPPIRDSLADRLHVIGGQHRYTVEMRLVGGMYFVRAYPPTSNRPLGQPPVSLSYKGEHLGNILGAAMMDLARLRNPQNSWVPSAREVVRCVA